METTNQPKKRSQPKSPPRKRRTVKHLETDTESTEDMGDEVAETLDNLNKALQAGRQILDPSDAILVFYVALVNQDGVISAVKGTTHLSTLLQADKRNSAAMTVDTMMSVAVLQPMVAKIQAHMEAASVELEAEPTHMSADEVQAALRSKNTNRLLGADNYGDTEKPVDGDFELDNSDPEE